MRVKFDKIYTKFNDNNNIKNEGYIQMKKTANIFVNYPYMVGDLKNNNKKIIVKKKKVKVEVD